MSELGSLHPFHVNLFKLISVDLILVLNIECSNLEEYLSYKQNNCEYLGHAQSVINVDYTNDIGVKDYPEIIVPENPLGVQFNKLLFLATT